MNSNKKRLKKIPDYTFLGCPLTKNRTPWCFAICVPEHGTGRCGRPAPHAIKSRIQIGIENYKASLSEKPVNIHIK